MLFFIGIVPPEKIYRDILHIQQQFGDNKTEPHITVKPPVALTQQHEWLQSVEIVTAAFPPFVIELTKTGMFGSRVLFIDLQSPTINELYKQIQTATKPFEKNHASLHNTYNPHLTLGRKWCGFTSSDFVQMKQLAHELLSHGPLSFPVLSLRIYYKPQSNNKYVRFKDVNFMGKTRKDHEQWI
ncbi:MAG: 2-5 ligase [Segetibacter sp.]|nr:2-5 ligase [Segetibacter sp.]